MEIASSSYETSATVEQQGQIHVSGVPFAPGTEVEVMISPKRSSGEEFAAAWTRLCSDLRDHPGIKGISDDEIGKEVQQFRSGR